MYPEDEKPVAICLVLFIVIMVGLGVADIFY